MMNLVRKSDYESYDYREFWRDDKRSYEDNSERLAIRKLLNQIDFKDKIFVDLGCGFGRLFNEYKNFDKIILVDYSLNNLKNAKDLITRFLNRDSEKLQNVYFIAADVNNLPFKSGSIDVVLTVRVVHHLSEPNNFFEEVKRIIKGRGYFFLEFANKRNMKNILKFFFRILKQSPFNFTPFQIGDTILNFHPTFIKQVLQEKGFKVLKQISVSNLRLAFLKKIISPKLLLLFENIYQNLFSFIGTGPSIFLKTIYATESCFNTSFNDSDAKMLEVKKFSKIMEILSCPSCRQDKLKFVPPDNVYCCYCKKDFLIVDNIYNFKL
jgi:ubiquinone/menaquinone biosynthesis C-methylase UbiE